MGFVKEFKEFAMRGNLVDLAVAVVIGGAFGKVISSFVDGMVMPVVGQLTSGVDFKNMRYILVEADPIKKIEEVSIKYGAFITQILDFMIVAFAVFLVIKVMNRLKKKEEAAPAAPAAPTKDQVLLTEIRDLLKK